MPTTLLKDAASDSYRTEHTPAVAPTQSAAKSTGFGWIWLIVVAAAFGGGWYLATRMTAVDHRAALPQSSETPSQSSDAVFVTAEPVKIRTVQRAVEAVGTLWGYEEVVISAKNAGRIQRIHQDVASRVKPGALLLEIDSTDSHLAYNQAERSLQAELIKWGLDQVPTDAVDLTKLPTVVSHKRKLDRALAKLERLKRLEASRVVSADDLEQAQTEADVAQAEYDNHVHLARSGAATVRLKNAELAIQKQRIIDDNVLAPMPTMVPPGFKGDLTYAVTNRSVSEGTQVQSGTELYRLVLDQVLKLRLSIPERHGSTVQPGQRVEVLTVTNSTPVIGQVTLVNPSVDTATRTFEVEVEIPNFDSRLKAGSFAKARILIGADPTAVTVPLSSLVSFAGINKIFVIEGDRAKEVRVELGEQTQEWIEISQPKLAADTQVIISGQRLLADETPVTLRDPGKESPQPEDKPATTSTPAQPR